MHEKIEIIALAYGGAGIGRVGGQADGKVVFVPYTAPGDMALVSITADKGRFFEARLVELLHPSPVRGEPLCPVYGRCGGCQWQHIKYPAQLEWKGKIFSETVKRIGKTDFEAINSPLPAPSEYAYRSRAQFHVNSSGWGFYEHGTNIVVDIDRCPLLMTEANDAFFNIKSALENKIPELTGVEIGVSEIDRNATALFHLKKNVRFDWQGALSGIKGLKGYEVRVSPRRHGPQKSILVYGDIRLAYDVLGASIEGSLGVFTQVNLAQNQALAGRVLDFARPIAKGAIKAPGVAVDLFSGIGNFSIPLAKSFNKVVAVEEHRDATRMARANAARSAVSTIAFSTLPAHEWLNDAAYPKGKDLAWGKADVVVLDPPRGGDKPAADALRAYAPERIVYVSCAPATLARDLFALTSPNVETYDKGAVYKATRAVVVDMFPQTYHIEAIVALDKISDSGVRKKA